MRGIRIIKNLLLLRNPY